MIPILHAFDVFRRSGYWTSGRWTVVHFRYIRLPRPALAAWYDVRMLSTNCPVTPKLSSNCPAPHMSPTGCPLLPNVVHRLSSATKCCPLSIAPKCCPLTVQRSQILSAVFPLLQKLSTDCSVLPHVVHPLPRSAKVVHCLPATP